MTPKKALALAVVIELVCPLIMGTAVASTIGKGIVHSEFIQSRGTNLAYIFILCAIIGAIIWNIITWFLGLPSSSSHALIGGLIGSGICVFGFQSIEWFNVLIKVVLMLFLTPVLGFIIGYIFMIYTNYLCRKSSPKVNKLFKISQIFSMGFLAASHSTNDAQKSMGIVTLILMISGCQTHFYVPFWVKLVSSSLMALGLSIGGWKIVRTVGRGIFHLKPIHSFVSQASSASVIFVSGLLGSPVSTSQIVSSSIMGVGAGERANAVRWNIVKNILISWVTTIPAAAVIASFTYFIVIHF
jgi:Phosphate/sulphate permeases